MRSRRVGAGVNRVLGGIVIAKRDHKEHNERDGIAIPPHLVPAGRAAVTGRTRAVNAVTIQHKECA
ncbi:MAG: hypothetical protein OXE84_02995 [Rhodobacteraceae bacterium]|nr:hypothetical protein [Paracoccaceae bacterium]MCY4326908.1 hypothetical protein [Paracoccaceae bacterium]